MEVPSTMPPLQYIPVHYSECVPHPMQIAIYGQLVEDTDLTRSIEEHGVLEPIIITPNPQGGYWLVSGNRRWLSVKSSTAYHVAELPAIVKDYESESDMVLEMIEANRQRVKKPSQQWGEMETSSSALERIAKARMTAGVTDPVLVAEQGGSGRVVEQLAERFNVPKNRVVNLQTIFSDRVHDERIKELEDKGVPHKELMAVANRWDEIRFGVDDDSLSLTAAVKEIATVIALAEEQIPGRQKRKPTSMKEKRPACVAEEGLSLLTSEAIMIGDTRVEVGVTGEEVSRPMIRIPGSHTQICFEWEALYALIPPRLKGQMKAGKPLVDAVSEN